MVSSFPQSFHSSEHGLPPPEQDLRASSAELCVGSGGPSGELGTASAAGSEIASGFSGGYGLGAGGGIGGVNANAASLYPAGSMRSASGRLLPVGDGGAGVQVPDKQSLYIMALSLNSCQLTMSERLHCTGVKTVWSVVGSNVAQ